jgi:2-hydroxy-3-oxopropionate reductase
MICEIAAFLKEKGAEMLDAPVARGVSLPSNGPLVIYVGGKKGIFEKCKGIMAAMGTDIYYVGGIGAGEVSKIVNNLMVATTTAALAEAMILGVKAGVHRDVLFRALSSGSGNSLSCTIIIKTM